MYVRDPMFEVVTLKTNQNIEILQNDTSDDTKKKTTFVSFCL